MSQDFRNKMRELLNGIPEEEIEGHLDEIERITQRRVKRILRIVEGAKNEQSLRPVG